MKKLIGLGAMLLFSANSFAFLEGSIFHVTFVNNTNREIEVKTTSISPTDCWDYGVNGKIPAGERKTLNAEINWPCGDGGWNFFDINGYNSGGKFSAQGAVGTYDRDDDYCEARWYQSRNSDAYTYTTVKDCDHDSDDARVTYTFNQSVFTSGDVTTPLFEVSQITKD